MTKDDIKSLVKADDKEYFIDILSFISSAVPWVGGPVSNVLDGISTARKIKRVNDFLHEFSEDLRDFKSDFSEEYVKTEDFEDLLEQTLRRTSEERNEKKRKILKSFIVDAIKNPGEHYDDQLRFLKLLENIYGDHIIILQTLMETPPQNHGMMGSPAQTLSERIPDMDAERIKELIQQFNDLRFTDLQSLNTMMSGRGTQDLSHSVTPLGKRFIQYLDNGQISEGEGVSSQ